MLQAQQADSVTAYCDQYAVTSRNLDLIGKQRSLEPEVEVDFSILLLFTSKDAISQHAFMYYYCSTMRCVICAN